MKLIIDMPEEKYKTIQEGMYCGMLDADLYRDIKNGTPLDDLRAEIIEMNSLDYVEPISCEEVLEIIDKYREDGDPCE